ELPYQMTPEGIYLVPYATEPFFALMMASIPKWEESIKGKCHKAVLCTFQKKDRSWNVMRSNEQPCQAPYAISTQMQTFLNASTSKYHPFFPTDTWSAANHLWAERLNVNYCSMGFHSDRRFDLCGDIRLYTDYSSEYSKLQLRANEMSV